MNVVASVIKPGSYVSLHSALAFHGMIPEYVAGPEKALLDLLYLTPGSEDPGYLVGLRLQHTDAFDLEKLRSIARSVGLTSRGVTSTTSSGT